MLTGSCFPLLPTAGLKTMEFLAGLPDALTGTETLFAAFDLKKVNEYYLFLKNGNEEGGFFSAGDAARIGDRHVYESMVYVHRIMSLRDVSRETKILDVGTGPGLPGYLFSCLMDPPYVTLLDSSRRRLSFLQKFHESSVARGAERVAFVYSRAEEFRGSFDLVVARALIPFPFSAILVRHLFKRRIALAAGPSPISPVAVSVLANYGLELTEESCPVPELDFLGERNLLLLRKIRPGSGLPPVAWKKLKNEMDEWRKLSQ